MSLARLQTYVTARQLDLPATAKKLHQSLRTALIKASNTGTLLNSPADIYKHLELLREPQPQILEDLRERNLHEGAFCIVVGREKNQERVRELPHFRRSDEAWFD